MLTAAITAALVLGSLWAKDWWTRRQRAKTSPPPTPADIHAALFAVCADLGLPVEQLHAGYSFEGNFGKMMEAYVLTCRRTGKRYDVTAQELEQWIVESPDVPHE